MSTVRRPPSPRLRPFVKTLWASDEGPLRAGAPRELVLPTGGMHVVLRLSPAPLRLYDDVRDDVGRVVSHAVVGGARDDFYVRDVSQPVVAVGAQLFPGAAEIVLGVPASELAGRHTPLDALWGADVDHLRARLADARSPDERLALFDAMLTARIAPDRKVHPAVARALAALDAGRDVRSIVDATGCSHRHFIELFRRSVGLAPKAYARVARFQRVVARGEHHGPAWAEIAADEGFSDQAHLSRDFRAIAGMSPGRYRTIAPSWSHHVPVR